MLTACSTVTGPLNASASSFFPPQPETAASSAHPNKRCTLRDLKVTIRPRTALLHCIAADAIGTPREYPGASFYSLLVLPVFRFVSRQLPAALDRYLAAVA